MTEKYNTLNPQIKKSGRDKSKTYKIQEQKMCVCVYKATNLTFRFKREIQNLECSVNVRYLENERG